MKQQGKLFLTIIKNVILRPRNREKLITKVENFLVQEIEKLWLLKNVTKRFSMKICSHVTDPKMFSFKNQKPVF